MSILRVGIGGGQRKHLLDFSFIQFNSALNYFVWMRELHLIEIDLS